ncbi:MAG: acyl carrier protein [Eubacteriales bacterium]
MDDILAFLQEQLSELCKLPADDITEDSNLLYDLGADSLDIVELLMAVEEKYGYYVPDDELIKMNTVGDLAQNIAAGTGR